MPIRQIKRFTPMERLSHLFLIITFVTQTITGFGRMYIVTAWGQALCAVFGGYERAVTVHHWGGALMMVGFFAHTLYLLKKINFKNWKRSIFGPDSIFPNTGDIKNFWQHFRWSFGLAKHPKFDRWTYWEKFDYWAVFWGIPLLGVTGLMLLYPIATSFLLPGWALNVASLVHRAEAILAVTYIFIVHFFIGHLRPANFPMNEVIFSGNISVDALLAEKPEWMKRLQQEGKIGLKLSSTPVLAWFRRLYFVFGYLIVGFGLYFLISGLVYSKYIRLH
jgi:cytochrome b subunit of formate dehydrogenase